MRISLALLIAPLALAACTTTPTSRSYIPPSSDEMFGCAISRPEAPVEVARRINAERASRGLQPLAYSTHLGAIAQQHACDNAARKSFSHEGSRGTTLGSRLATGGYQHLGARENTGLGRFDSAAMVAYWRNSPEHMANMMAPELTELGLGVARTEDGRNAWVMLLAKRR